MPVSFDGHVTNLLYPGARPRRQHAPPAFSDQGSIRNFRHPVAWHNNFIVNSAMKQVLLVGRKFIGKKP